ncbi:MAG: TonB-dependent receptor [Colwellia sp.]
MKNYKIKYLSLMISALVCTSASSASSQTNIDESGTSLVSDKEATIKKANKKQTKQDDVEVISVTGFRSSLAKSLAVKKDALNLVDAISAEDVGKLPDVNVAEALQRIAGITVSRERGNGQSISVRGLTGGFNMTTLNGRKLATDNAGRNFNYDVLSSGIISSIEVSKTPKAEFTEGGIGAIVDIKTVRPLNTEGTNFTFSAENVYKDLAEKNNPKTSLFFTNNVDDTFGVAAGLIYSKTQGRYDYMAIYDYYRQETLDIGNDGDSITGNMPDYVTYNTSKDDNDRLSGNFALQWRPTEDLDINFDALYSTYNVNNIASGISLGMSQPLYPFHGTWTYGEVDDDGNIIKLTVSDPFLIDLLHIENHRKTTTQAFGLNVMWFVDNFIFESDISHSSASNENDGDNKYVVARSAIDSATYDNSRGGSVPDMIFSSQLDASNGFGAHYASFSGLGSEDEVDQLNFKGSWLPDIEYLTSLDFGLGYAGQTKARDNWRAENPSAFSNGKIDGVDITDESLLIHNGGFTWLELPESVMKDSTVDDFLGQEEGNFPRQWASIDMDALEAFYQSIDPAAADKLIAHHEKGSSYAISEDVLSAYVQANIEGQLWDQDYYLNIGGRFVETSITSEGFSQNVDKITRDEQGYPIDTTYTALTPVNKKDSYSNFLPSLNFKWNLFDDYIFRVAASKVLSRPDLASMSPYESVTVKGPALKDNTKRVSNPGLKPFTAKQIDIGLEWYFSDLGAMTAAFYYKDIANFVTNETHIENIDGYDFEVIMPVNNDESSIIKGLELAYQQSLDEVLPEYLSGFGFLINYTYSDTDSGKENARGEKVGFIGMSKNSYNIQAYYDEGALSTRLAYSYRDSYLVSIHSSDWGYDTYADAVGYLDWSTNYDLTDKISVRASVNNLTDEGERKYSGDKNKVAYQAYWGRTLTLGVTARF